MSLGCDLHLICPIIDTDMCIGGSKPLLRIASLRSGMIFVSFERSESMGSHSDDAMAVCVNVISAP